jgi:hypothetical protein
MNISKWIQNQRSPVSTCTGRLQDKKQLILEAIDYYFDYAELLLPCSGQSCFLLIGSLARDSYDRETLMVCPISAPCEYRLRPA